MEGKWERELAFQRQRKALKEAFCSPGHFACADSVRDAMRMRQMMEHPEEFVIDPTGLRVTLAWIGDIQEYDLEESIRVQVILERVVRPASFEFFPLPNDSNHCLKHEDEIERRLQAEILRRNRE